MSNISTIKAVIIFNFSGKILYNKCTEDFPIYVENLELFDKNTVQQVKSFKSGVSSESFWGFIFLSSIFF
jgi:hypothetical protein